MGETLHLLVLEEALRLGKKSGGYAREPLPIYRGRYMEFRFRAIHPILRLQAESAPGLPQEK
jgi:hypothetical protein